MHIPFERANFEIIRDLPRYIEMRVIYCFNDRNDHDRSISVNRLEKRLYPPFSGLNVRIEENEHIATRLPGTIQPGPYQALTFDVSEHSHFMAKFLLKVDVQRF